ncbi:DUF4240 domain-containing protein [uncultured Roseibium sp.]|uniref:DUF4240 domain-containing protein n=1 Tax=uncultured Roseibium sp. TaxID=1936171 RepID=UPI002628FC6C|nr:DUF4240 domain-containing protein [uncultured Roseibium sp.]
MQEQISISENEAFDPSYDDLSKDFERLRDLIAALHREGRLYREWDRSRDCFEPAAIALEDAYFALGLYDEIEAHYTHTVHQWDPNKNDLIHDVLERLLRDGQGQRVIRICRYYLALEKPSFWFLIDERKRGFRKSPNWSVSEKQQQKSFEKMINGIAHRKAEVLAMMDEVHDFFLRSGATSAQLGRLAADRAEIEQEQRRRRKGKPDPRVMDIDLFWEIIGTPGESGALEQIEAATDRLASFKARAIKAFDELFHDLDARAYRDDVWSLAVLLRGGCSDDDFEGFRCWLILQGRDVFEAVLKDPDAFDVTLFGEDTSPCDALRDIPSLAYEMRTGKALNRKKRPPLRLTGTDWREEDVPDRLPRVVAALGD